MIRYFFAVTPPAPLLNRIEGFRSRWGPVYHRVEPHVTVRSPFLWPDEPGFLAPVQEACSHLAPFLVTLGPTGRFPAARVLYLSVMGQGLYALHEAVGKALEGAVPPEGHRVYTPHLTLAAGRFGIDEAGVAEMERLAAEELANLPPFTVSSLRCYWRGESAQRWEPFREVPLGAGKTVWYER